MPNMRDLLEICRPILIERSAKDEVSFTTKYDSLYQLTDYEGLSHTYLNGGIRSRVQSFISTTYDPKKLGVQGRDHYDFRFIVDAKRAAEDFGVFVHRFYGREVDSYGRSKMVDFKEREIGVTTRELPLEYLTGLDILIPISSRAFAQWMLYRRRNKTGITGIKALAGLRESMPVRVFDGRTPRPLNPTEEAIIKTLIQADEEGLDYPTALERLTRAHMITSHWGKTIEPEQIGRERQARAIMTQINDVLTRQPYAEIDGSVIAPMMGKIIAGLGYGGNFRAMLIHEIEKRGLFTAHTAPVEWVALLRGLIDGDSFEDLMQALDYASEQVSMRRNADANRHPKFAVPNHSGSMMASVGDGY